MPSTSKSTRLYSTQSSSIGYTLTASLNENSTNTANNTSNVTLTATLASDKISFSYTNACTLSLYVYDNNSSPNGTLVASKNITTLNASSSTSVSGTFDAGHKSDGTLTMSAKAVLTKNTGAFTPQSGAIQTDTISLTSIPRKTSITSFTVSKRSETTFTFNWKTADTIDYAWYSTNNGGSWTGVDVTDGTSGSFTVSGLSANTTYNCKLRVRRKDSQLTTDSGTVSQTTYKIPTQSLKSKTETSITMNWSIDSTANYIWYSTNGGSSWTAVGSVNATSGSYTISGLSANTAYNIRTRIRRSAASTTYDIASTSITTYQYPYVSAVQTSALTIGNSQKLTLYNPLGRSVTVYMKQTNTSGTTLYSKSNVTGTSLTFTPTASTLYASIPNATSGNAVYYCVYSSHNVGTKSGTYVVNNSSGQQNPTFATSNWSYTANYTNLTNNDKVVIAGISTVTFTINTAATPKNSATIKNYKLIWGSKNTTITSGSGTIATSTGNSLQIIVTDSRGYSTTSTLNLGNNYISYFAPTNSFASTLRDDGIGTDTTLSLRGTFFNAKFGSSGTTNAISSAKYYTSTNNSTWSSAYNIPVSNFAISNNNYTLNEFQIHANGSSGGFPVGTQYYIKVQIIDKLKTSTFTNIIVTNGKLAIDTYQDNNGEYHRGVNGLAKDNYALTVYGDINPSDGQLIRSTGGNYIDDRDLAPVANKKAGGQGTYNPVASVKTNSGNWTIGNLGSNDNLLFNYTTDSDYSSSTNNSTKFQLNPTNGLFNITSRYSYHVLTNPTTSTSYYLPFIDGIADATRYTIRGNDGVRYTTREGTTSQIGNSYLILGNDISSGIEKNKRGLLRIYSNGSYYTNIYHNASTTENYNNYLPNHSGTIQVRPTNLYNNTSGTNGTVTLSSSAANFNYLDIYWHKSNVYGFSRVYSPNGKTVALSKNGYDSSVPVLQSVAKQIGISGTSITTSSTYRGYGNITGTNACAISSENAIYIVRVDGWV